MNKPLLFIDARNVLYRAIYSNRKRQNQQVKYHYIVTVLQALVKWMRKYDPESVHVFWDAPRETVWRRMALKTYKDRSTSQYVDDISEDLYKTTNVAMELFKFLNIRQYSKKQMEADDLIYAAAAVAHPSRSVIVSSDSDLLQIPYMFSSAVVFDPGTAEEAIIPKHHPAMYKSIVGDSADSIKGYYGIGPKKGMLLLDNPKGLQEFLEMKGRKIYHLNLLLTDLSLCPKLMANKLYIQKTMAADPVYDRKAVIDLTRKFKLVGLDIEFANLVPPFSKLI